MAAKSGGEAFGASATLSPIDASSGSVVVPDAQLLFTADYTRVGDDLLLSGADGTTLVIQNYFALDAAPALFSPEGAMMAPHLVANLVASQTPRQLAQAEPIDTEQPIGEVQDVVGTAAVIRDGVPVTLVVGDPLFQNDVVQTGLTSELGIGFADGTVFTLAANARITLDGMIYDPAGADNSLVLSVVQGTFAFVTGQIAPTGEMLVKTPVATIGIRGTIGLCKLASALGPLSCTASATEGDPTNDVTYEHPLTGEFMGLLGDPTLMFEVFSLGAEMLARPATADERVDFLTQSNFLRNAQQSFQFSFDPGQPIFQPASDTGPGDPPIPVEAGPGLNQSGGVGFDDIEFIEELEPEEPVVTAASFVITTTSQPDPPSTQNSFLIQTPPPEPNVAPTAEDDAPATSEDTPLVINVLSNDRDPDSSVLTVSAVSQGANGSVAINSDGTVTYTPNPNFNGSDSFTYTVTDGIDSDTATVTVTVNPVNDPPVAQPDTVVTDEDTPVAVAVLANDSDVDGDALSVSAVSQGANGSVAINSDGTVTYTPDPEFIGVDSFTYTVSDGLDSDTGTVTVTVGDLANLDQTVIGTEGPDTVITGTGNDTITTLGGADQIVSSDGDDTIVPGPDDDSVNAGGGDDTILYTVGDGGDTIVGGPGNDTLVIAGATGASAVNITGSAGNPNLTVTVAGADLSVTEVEEIVILGGAGNDTVIIVGDLVGISQNTVAVDGGAGADTVDASDMTSTQSLVLLGGAGDDALTGGPGNDILTGGAGNDAIDGGGGADVAVFAGNIADFSFQRLENGDLEVTDTADGSEGTDTLRNVETLRFDDGDATPPVDFDIAATATFVEDLADLGLNLPGGTSRSFTDNDTGFDDFDGGEGSAGPLPDSLPVVDNNGTLETAQDIPRAAFGIAPDPNLGDDSLPSVIVNGLINQRNDIDYYRFELQAGETVTLDIDFGEDSGADAVDIQVFLLDAAGNVVDEDDDSSITNGGAGSIDSHDSFLQFTAPASGVFFVGVTSFNNDISDGGAGDNDGSGTGDYVLNVSIEPTANSTGLGGGAGPIGASFLLVADEGGNNILAVSLDGSQIEVAVSEQEIFDVIGVAVDLDESGVAADAAGNIFFSTDAVESGDPEFVLVKLAGSGEIREVASTADVIDATDSSGFDPEGLVLDSNGTLYVLDDLGGGRVIKIENPLGTPVISELISGGDIENLDGVDSFVNDQGIAIDGNTLYLPNEGSPNGIIVVDLTTLDIGANPPAGVSLLAAVDGGGLPFSFDNLDDFITVAPGGDIIVAEGSNNRLLRIDPDTGLTTVFLSRAQIAEAADTDFSTVDLEGGFAFDANGNFYLAESGTDSILRWPALDPVAGTIDPSAGIALADDAALGAGSGAASINLEGGLTVANVTATPEPGFLFEFQVGEAGIVADNIRGTDLEDGVTSQFTITDVPRNAAGEITGVLAIDRGGDGTIDDVLEAADLGTAAANVQSGDSVFYFLSEDDFQVTPEAVSFTYLTLDSDGLPSDGATATVTFGNAPPRADDATLAFVEDSQDNDLGLSAPLDPDGDPVTITVDALPDFGLGRVTLANGETLETGQTLSVDQLLGLQYDTVADANGPAGPFVYSVSDGSGGTDTGIVDIDITPVNDPPVVDGSGVLRVGSVADSRFNTTWTLDGSSLTADTRAKLLNLDNFGPGGTAGTRIEITDTAETLDAALLSNFDAFFIGFLDDADVNAFTAAELTALKQFAEDGGTLIVTADAPSHDEVASFLGFPVTNPATEPVTPTPEGVDHPLFDGPFGTVDSLTLSQAQGFFTTTSGATVLAADPDGDPVVMVANVGSGSIVLLGDINIISNTDLSDGGAIDSGNDNDIFLGNLFAFAASNAGALAQITVDEDSQNVPLGLDAPFDVDGDDLTITVKSEPNLGRVTLANGGALEFGDQITIDELLGLQFDTFPNLNGAAGQFVYAVSDGTVTVDGTVNFDITPVNDAPVVDLNGAANGIDFAAAFTEGDNPVAIADPGAFILDIDSPNLVSVTVRIANVLDTGNEVLTADFLDTSIEVSGRGTDTLTLTGNVGPAEFVDVLRTVTYQNTAPIPTEGARRIEVVANDGEDDSQVATATVAVAQINDPPVVDLDGAEGGIGSFASFTEDGGPVAIAPAGLVLDVDSDTLASVTVRITNVQDPGAGTERLTATTSGGVSVTVSADGSLTMTGPASPAAFQTVLRTVTYENTSQNPTAGLRQIEVQADDGAAENNLSLVAVATVRVNAVNDAPVVDLNGPGDGIDFATTFTEGEVPVPIAAPDAAVFDVDTTFLDSLRVTLTNRPDGTAELLDADPGATDIQVSFDSTSGVLVFAGSSPEDYQAVLRTVTYENTSDNPTAGVRTITVQADDDSAPNNLSAVAESSVEVIGVNDVPVVDLNGDANGIDFVTDFTEGGSAVEIAGFGAAVTDLDSATLASLTVTITDRPDGAAEILDASPRDTGINVDFNAATGVLTLTGGTTLDDYQEVLSGVTYENTSQDPSEGDRRIEVVADDGQDLSQVAVATVTVTPVNDPPVLGNNNLAIGEGDTVVLTNANLSATDVDNADAALRFVVSGVTGGAFQLESGAQVDDFSQQQVIDGEIRFVHNGGDAAPSYLVSVFDGLASTTPTPATIDFSPLNDAPVIENLAGDVLFYTEGDGAVLVDRGTLLTVTDTDSPNLASIEARLTVRRDGDAEVLSVNTGTSGIEAAYDSANGILTLTGPASPAAFQTVLRTLRYENSSQNPTPGDRRVQVNANDGAAENNISQTAQATVNVGAVNDPPLVDLNGGGGGRDFQADFVEGAAPINITGAIAFVEDVDSPTLASLSVTVTNVADAGAELLDLDESLAESLGIDVAGAGTAALILSGDASPGDYTQVLRTVTYENTSENPADDNRIIEVRADDGGAANSPLSVAQATVTITGVNDDPVVTTGAAAVDRGASVTVTGDILQATDAESGPADLTYTVTEQVNGQVLVQGDPGSRFTQADVDAGEVAFLHDNTASANASFMVTATDPDGGSFGPVTVDLSVTGLPFSGDVQEAGATAIQDVDPRATYLRTDDSRVADATAFSLAADGFVPGDIVVLEQLGDFFLGGNFGTSDETIAVFSGSATLLDPDQDDRVEDAIDAGEDVVTAPTAQGTVPTDIEEDFEADPAILRVPGGATHLFFSTLDTDFLSHSSTDEGFRVRIDKPLVVGVTGEGFFTLGAGESFEETNVILGFDAGARATASVTGAGADLTVENMVIGHRGVADFTLGDGASLTAANIALGFEEGGEGTLTATGAGTALNVTRDTSLVVGLAGTGSLDITDGASVTVGTPGSDAEMSIGDGPSGVGTVTVDNATLAVNGSIGLIVGFHGTGILEITDNAAVTVGTPGSDARMIIGEEPSGVGTVTVNAATLTVTGTGGLTVGDEGTGSLFVEQGGTVTANAEFNSIGTFVGSTGEVHVEQGGTFTVNGQLTVGNGFDPSGGNSNLPNASGLLEVYGGKVTTQGLIVGGFETGEGRVVVDRGGSLTDSIGLVVGDQGVGELIVRGTVNANGDANNGESNVIANDRGATGKVTVQGPDAQFNVEHGLVIGRGFSGPPGTGEDFAEGTLELIHGGTATLGSLSLADSNMGTGKVLVRGASGLTVNGSFQMGGLNRGEADLDIVNGGHVEVLDAGDGFGIGSNATLTAGAGSLGLGDMGFLSLDSGGTVNLGEGPGTFDIEGGYTQRAGGTLNLTLGAGGASVEASGNATFLSAAVPPTVNLIRGTGENAPRFGDAFTLSAGSVVGLTIPAINLVGFTLDTGSGVDLHARSTSSFGGDTFQFTAITSDTEIRSTEGSENTVTVTDIKELYTDFVDNVANNGTLNVFSNAGEESFAAFNDDVTTTDINVSGEGTSRLVLNGATNAAANLAVGFGVGGATAVVGSFADLTLTGTANVGGNGPALDELVVHGVLSLPDLIAGNLADANGRVTVAGGELSVTGDNALVVGDEGKGELIVSDGGTVNAAGDLFIAGVTGSSGSVTVTDDGSQLTVGGFLLVGMDFDGIPLGPNTGGTGTLTIGDFGQVNAGQVFIGTGGTLGGTGNLAATTTTLDGGAIAPGFSAGSLDLGGDLTINGGALNIELGGAADGQFDVLDITGAATLGGTLNVTLIDGFTPTIGQAFDIITAGAFVDVFDNGNLPDLGGLSLILDDDLSDGVFTLSVGEAANPLGPTVVNFVATVSSAQFGNGDPSSEFVAGDTLVASIAYDTSVIDTNPDAQAGAYPGAVSSLSVSFLGSGQSWTTGPSAGGTVQTFNNFEQSAVDVSDQVFFFGGGGVTGNTLNGAAVDSLELDFIDGEILPDTPQMLSSDGIPTRLPVNDGDPNDDSFFIIGNDAGEAVFVDFVIDVATNAIFGTPDNDTIVGTNGDDLIFGFGGDDSVGGRAIFGAGGAGNDSLTGGAGADTFNLNVSGDPLSPGDVITDFEDGVDQIVFHAPILQIVGFGDLTISDGGTADTTISFGAETVAVVQGVTQDLLTEADIAVQLTLA